MPVDEDRPSGAAGWFDAAVLAAAAALVTFGLPALVLALVDAYSVPAVLVAGLVVWAAAIGALRHTMVALWHRPTTAAQHAGAVAALLLAVLAIGWYGHQPSQHLLVERDPGAYVTTALWVSRDGSLVDRDVAGAFEGVPGVVFGSPGSYLTSEGLEFQFNHFTGVVGAVAHGLGGRHALFRVTGWVTVLGLLAVYAVTARATRRPWLSLLAPVVLGAALPVVVLARDMYSEPFLLAVLWSLVLLADQCWHRPSRGAALVAGLFSGALLAIRVESLLYLTALVVLAAFAWFRGGPQRRGVVVPYLVGIVPGAAIGLYDFAARTGGYTEVIGNEVRTAVALLVAVVVAAVVGLRIWDRREGLRTWAERHRVVLAGVAAGLVAVVLAGLWLVRPLLPVDRLEVERWGVLGPIQAREGDAVDPFRSYYELSVRWIEWYVGPAVVALGIAGIATMVHRLVRGRLEAAGVVALAVFSTGGLAYLVAPGINPDQLWATRRLVPVALVTVVLGAVWLVGAAMDLVPQRRGATAALGAVAALVMVGPTVRATAPVALVSEQPAMWGAIDAVCDDVGADGAVAVVGVPARDLLPMALRARCGVPVAELDTGDPELAVAHARQLETALRAQGRTLTLVGMDQEDLAPFAAAGLGTARRSAATTNPREHEHTLNRRPERYLQGEEIFFLPREIVIWSLPVGAQ